MHADVASGPTLNAAVHARLNASAARAARCATDTCFRITRRFGERQLRRDNTRP